MQLLLMVRHLPADISYTVLHARRRKHTHTHTRRGLSNIWSVCISMSARDVGCSVRGGRAGRFHCLELYFAGCLNNWLVDAV